MDKQFFLNLSARLMNLANECYQQSKLIHNDEASKNFLLTMNKKLNQYSWQARKITLKS